MTTLHRAILLSALVSVGAAGLAAATVSAQTTSKSAVKPAAAPAPKPTDSELRDRIAHRLDTDAALHKYDVKVSVAAGTATLTGTVSTAAQKTEAARVAHVTGVTKVVNEVTVDPNVDKSLMEKAKSGLSKTGETITDAWITAKVHYHFLGEDTLKGSDINVDTANHVVTLKGTVKTTAGKTRAEVLARQTDGVTKVVDQLTVSAK
jgi:osmotically-inducible protein OsmY